MVKSEHFIRDTQNEARVRSSGLSMHVDQLGHGFDADTMHARQIGSPCTSLDLYHLGGAQYLGDSLGNPRYGTERRCPG